MVEQEGGVWGISLLTFSSSNGLQLVNSFIVHIIYIYHVLLYNFVLSLFSTVQVLQTFLARPRIYFTEELHKAFEDHARRNMQGEIEMLQKQAESIV